MNHNPHLAEWKRLLFGDAPPVFLAEVLLRSVVMYLALLLTLRFLGKRMNGQLSITELAVMISLGAIVSVPMETAKQGLLPGFVLLFMILLFQRGLGYLSFKSGRIGRLVYGRPSTLVKDGVLQPQPMKREGITRNQLFAHMRYHEVGQLGEVDRVYLEATGMFSVFRAPSPRPGLSTLPAKDGAEIARQGREAALLVCAFCGAPKGEAGEGDECAHCRNYGWTPAVTDDGR